MSRTKDRMPMKDHRIADVVLGPHEGSGLDRVIGVPWLIEELRGRV